MKEWKSDYQKSNKKNDGEQFLSHSFLSQSGMIPGIAVVITVIVGAIGLLRTAKQRQLEAKAQGRHVPYGVYEAALKRPLDVILSAAALILLSPVMGLTALIVRVKLGTPVLFQQRRPGKDGRIFTIYKFRTMTDERDQNGNLLPDEKRLTKFGEMLRSTSLDELPELINIFKGDMSIVGPRPLLVEYLKRYSPRQARRHEVRPGLTGYAQVSGRNGLSWEEKFEDDVEYVEHITFLRDLWIIWKTVKTVLRREGIGSSTSVTMEKFMGKQDEIG